MLKAVIFDMDGTLVDSEPVWDLVFEEIVVKQGKTYKQVVHQELLGTGITNSAHILKLRFELPQTESEIIDEIIAGFKKQILENPPKEKTGVTNLIHALHAQGIKTAVATGTNDGIASKVIATRGWTNDFPIVVTGEQVEHGKPAPDIYLKTAEKLGVDPKDSLVFEDAPSGIQSAHDAGMKVVGIFDPDFPADLKEADKVINQFDQITVHELEELMSS